MPTSTPLVSCTALLDAGRGFQGIEPVLSPSPHCCATLHSRTSRLPPRSFFRDGELLANGSFSPLRELQTAPSNFGHGLPCSEPVLKAAL